MNLYYCQPILGMSDAIVWKCNSIKITDNFHANKIGISRIPTLLQAEWIPFLKVMPHEKKLMLLDMLSD